MLLLVLLSAYICMGLCYTPVEEERKHYGDRFSWRFPREAESLEFIPSGYGRDSVVLWRRSAPTAEEESRGRMEGRRWVMEKLTQDDEGRYNLRSTNGKLIQAKKIEVSEQISYLNRMVGENVTITFNLDLASSDVYFSPKDLWSHRAIRRGNLETEYFEGRLELHHYSKSSFYTVIHDLKTTDTGSFHLKDQNQNQVLTVHLDVQEPDNPSLASLPYIGIAVGIIAVLVVCCCCVRKCCCKKSSPKTDSPVAHTPAAPAVYYHDNVSGHVGPKYDQPPAPTNPTQSPTYFHRSDGSTHFSGPSHSGPSYSSHSPLVHNPTVINVTSPQPEVPTTAGQGAAPTVPIGYDASDHGPRFELKGLKFPSAPPLSSDTSTCDVYTSEKLNFL